MPIILRMLIQLYNNQRNAMEDTVDRKCNNKFNMRVILHVPSMKKEIGFYLAEPFQLSVLPL